jgi:MSHA biogenesis protein MshI
MPALFHSNPLRWPWRPRKSSDQFVVSWMDKTLSYVKARVRKEGGYEIQQTGVERQGAMGDEDFVRRLQSIGLKGARVHVMLRPDQYQLLQIEAPGVAPEELRAAARYQIRDMLDVHVDDITLDVMRVGDGKQKGTPHLFVVAAANATLRQALDLGQSMGWEIPVIDVQETAQRNLQNALASRSNLANRAHAALVLGDEHQAVLTISANEELFYSRRIELPAGLMSGSWSFSGDAGLSVAGGFTPVGEYVPDYSVDGAAYGDDYSATTSGNAGQAVSDSGDGDKAQRFLVEVQRSLDLWDRSWSSMPLASVQVYAGTHSDELAKWLTRELGLTVQPMNVQEMFAGFERCAASEQALCWPLLGTLMRTESRKL